MAFGGVLMDYHLIFMMICFFLFFFSILLIWMVGTKQACIVATLMLSINLLFCIMSMVGFYSIGYVGYDGATSAIMGYNEMVMFSVVFLCLLWLDGLMLVISIFKYMRLLLNEELGSDYGYSDRDYY